MNFPLSRFQKTSAVITQVLDQWSGRLAPSAASQDLALASGIPSVREYVRPITRLGTMVALVMFGLFLAWSFLAPLNSAAVAPGTIVPDTNKKTIQHLEGGIIEEIFVRDGDEVKGGDPLLRLSKTRAETSEEILQNQLYTARAMEERLLAEQAGKQQLVFSDELLSARNQYPKLQEILDTQQQIFVSRVQKNSSQTDTIRQRIAQLNEEIQGMQAQLTAASGQIRLIAEEMVAVEKLVSQGYAPKPRLLALRRQHAELLGRHGEYQASIARARQSIIENELQIQTVTNEFMERVVAELRETQNVLAETEEKMKSATDTLERVLIAAPQTGMVTGLKYFTIGGVIPPGESILDIVPLNDQLVIEAQVQPLDIDIVHKGLPAQVRLTAFRARFMPPLEGTVAYVSPDRFTDSHTGRPYYVARVTVDQKDMKKLGENVKLYPGMPAEVMIITGERSFISYLLDPLTHSFGRAFREE